MDSQGYPRFDEDAGLEMAEEYDRDEERSREFYEANKQQLSENSHIVADEPMEPMGVEKDGQ